MLLAVLFVSGCSSNVPPVPVVDTTVKQETAVVPKKKGLKHSSFRDHDNESNAERLARRAREKAEQDAKP